VSTQPDIPTIRLSGQVDGALETARVRLIAGAAIFALCVLVLAARLVDLTLFRGDAHARRGGPAPAANLERGDITDRHGVLLATNLVTASLYADPRAVSEPGDVARRIVAVLPDLSEADLLRRLESGRSFVWLKRNLTPRQQQQVNALGIPGLGFQRESKRIYPQGMLAAHVLGYTDVDRHGIAGVEKYFDDSLANAKGQPLPLSIDLRVQHTLREEVDRAVTEHRALGGAGVVLDVSTGEVLGLVSLPDFDPNAPTGTPTDTLFNRATLGVYELGSVFKIFNTAMALDAGVTDMTGGYDATHPIRVARFEIHDDHAKRRWLSVPEIFMYSSNIGSAKMALDAGGQRQRDFLSRAGMLNKLPVELPEIGQPLYPTPWRDINVMTVAFGHGIAITRLHLATGVAAVANGGTWYAPTVVKRSTARPANGQRVMSFETSDKMRRLLRLVVTDGTGKKAAAEGYLVGGKTGTAEKIGRHGYRKKALISSFVAAFPMQAPRYVVLVVLDEPQPSAATYGYATGGWVAAPAVRNVITRVAPVLGVDPIDETDEAAQRAMFVNVGGRKVASR
jgi:cell division protein FtsI (penicillin-binding protein 3)